MADNSSTAPTVKVVGFEVSNEVEDGEGEGKPHLQETTAAGVEPTSAQGATEGSSIPIPTTTTTNPTPKAVDVLDASEKAQKAGGDRGVHLNAPENNTNSSGSGSTTATNTRDGGEVTRQKQSSEAQGQVGSEGGHRPHPHHQQQEQEQQQQRHQRAQQDLEEASGPVPSSSQFSELTHEKSSGSILTQSQAVEAKAKGPEREETTFGGEEEKGEKREGKDQSQQPATRGLGASEVSSAVDESAALQEQSTMATTTEVVEDHPADQLVTDQQLSTKLSLRSPVMILPLTDTMTLSPMHGQQRSTLDDILIKKEEVSAESSQTAVAKTKAEGEEKNEKREAAPSAQEKEKVEEQRQPQAQAQVKTAVDKTETTGAKNPSAITTAVAPSPLAAGKTEEASQQPQQQQQQSKKKEKKEKKEPPKNIEFKKKPKLTKAERRELQERQRAAKAALKAEQGGGGGGGGGGGQGGSSSKKAQLSQSQSQSSSASHRPPSGPYGEFDNEKHNLRRKRKSLVPREIQKSRTVELFSHLPQFDNKQLEKSFQSLLSSGLHPEVVKLGQAYANLSISGANARCLAMLAIFKLVIQDYNTPPGKSLTRDLTNHINVIIQFLIDCRPLAVTMGNAIRFFKTKVGSIHPSTPDMEAKTFLIETIDSFIQDKILDASGAVAETASTKIQEGDVILTYAMSSSVLKTLEAAHRRGCKFRVIVVDSRPHFEGSKLLSKLCKMGISCTYAYITSLSYILPQVTTVFIGAAAALANGTVVSRVGTAAVAVMAAEFNIPVVVCCETYKFSHRVQLDALTHNELGDPDALVEVKDRPEVKLLQKWDDLPNLRLLNLRYDALAEKYITMIATEVGMIPASSVPVILREYNVCGPLV